MMNVRFFPKVVVLIAALALSFGLGAGQAFASVAKAPAQGGPSQLVAAQAAQESQESQGGVKAVEQKVAKPQIKYRAYVKASWTKSWKKNGSTIGTKNKKLQRVKIKLANDGLSGSVKYRVYSRGKGWLKWAKNGKAAGTKDWYFRGLQVKLTGKIGKQFDVVYRVYLKGAGWQPWVVNGATAGSSGKLGQVEQFQVKLVRKNTAKKISNGAYIMSFAKGAASTMQLPGSKGAANVQMTKAWFSRKATNLRFYVRKKADGSVLLQSCASGLFLCDQGGKVVQRPYANAEAFFWNISAWNGGQLVTNVQTARALKFSGGKAVTAKKGARWVFTPIDILANGTYSLTASKAGTLLAVRGQSAKNKAKLIVQAEERTNAEVFAFKRVAKNTYRLTNEGSGKRIEVANGSDKQGAAVQQNAAKSGDLQKWKLGLAADGTVTLTNVASGKALTASGAAEDGSYVRSKANTGAATQRWKLRTAKPYLLGPEARAAKFADSVGSLTDYFITVDLTNHWVCIFQGSKGNRSLIKSWPCSTGRPGSPTPTGEYTTDYKQYEFGDGYSCYYATAFIGYEYLFHSVKYYKNSSTILDGRLGESVSEGCVRLDIDNAQWIYDYIPSGTKVKIYY